MITQILFCASGYESVIMAGFFAATVLFLVIYRQNLSTPCDTPLKAVLVGWAVMFLLFLVAVPMSYTSRPFFRVYGPVYLILVTLYFVVWLVLSNVWVFSSKTCQSTSAGVTVRGNFL